MLACCFDGFSFECVSFFFFGFLRTAPKVQAGNVPFHLVLFFVCHGSVCDAGSPLYFLTCSSRFYHQSRTRVGSILIDWVALGPSWVTAECVLYTRVWGGGAVESVYGTPAYSNFRTDGVTAGIVGLIPSLNSAFVPDCVPPSCVP